MTRDQVRGADHRVPARPGTRPAGALRRRVGSRRWGVLAGVLVVGAVTGCGGGNTATDERLDALEARVATMSDTLEMLRTWKPIVEGWAGEVVQWAHDNNINGTTTGGGDSPPGLPKHPPD